ncbi:MAG: hypothetical protein JWN90_118 [Parcubacteria group bacterium]|nr:hypothetical protein [Parcubacteria group bacterium]
MTSKKLIIAGIVILLAIAAIVFLKTKSETSTNEQQSDVALEAATSTSALNTSSKTSTKPTYALKDMSGNLAHVNVGGKGVTGYSYITLDQLTKLNSYKGWYSWQGNDVVWVPFWRGEDPKIAYKIEGADVTTFRVFNTAAEEHVWAEDAHHVYFKYSVIPDADINTFTLIDSDKVGFYGQDKNFTYVSDMTDHLIQTPVSKK